MVDNTCSVGWNLKQGLESKGHSCTLVSDVHTVHSGTPDVLLDGVPFFSKDFSSDDYDIVHMHGPNTKKILQFYNLVCQVPFVCHWHGTGLRCMKSYHPVRVLCRRYGDFHLYSTIDLGWFITINFDKDKSCFFRCPVDTEQFRVINKQPRDKGILRLDNSNKSYVEHEDMPGLYNQYERVSVKNLIDPRVVSVSALEGAACGCKVEGISYLNRSWVVRHASVRSQTEKLLEIYKGGL